MIKHTFLGFMLVTSSQLFAGDLENLQIKLKSLTTFNAHFSQVVKDEQGNIVQQGAGTIALKQPNKINWQQTQPDETLFVSDGNQTFYFDSFAEQVTILETKDLIDSSPFVLLTSFDEKLWHKYTVEKLISSYKITPKSLGAAQVASLTVSFADNDAISSLVVVDVSGQTSDFIFTETKVNQVVDDAIFTFKIPEGMEIDDQRQGEEH